LIPVFSVKSRPDGVTFRGSWTSWSGLEGADATGWIEAARLGGAAMVETVGIALVDAV
jgi:hypothetical protein